MDVYVVYNQIIILKLDEELTSFIINMRLFFYKVMSFGLKNAEITYQKLVNRMFTKQTDQNMKVYVDDMLVKSKLYESHVSALAEMFEVIRK